MLAPVSVMAAELYVSPTGNDANRGSQAEPFATLAAARDAASRVVGQESVTVHVADGVYYLPEPLVFDPDDSGSAEYPVVYRAAHEGGAILSGGSRLELTWKRSEDGIYHAVTPAGLVIDQLFVDGQNQRMARYPNYDATKKTAAYQGFAADAFSRERAAGWANPVGGYIHAMHRARWGGYHYRITGKDSKGEVTFEGGWQNNRQMGMHHDFRMVENIFEELDAPGEWFHDAARNTLYYMPADGINLANAVVEVVRLRHLIEFQGTADSPVHSISLQGFVFRHAARTFMETKEPMLRSDWTIYRGGAVLLTGTEDIQILDSEFDQVGGNAIFVSNYNRRVLVTGCHIHDVGASGVCFVGDPNAVRDPLFEYSQTNDLTRIDRAPGPKTSNYPSDSIVADCLIHGIGRVERQPAGVQIEMSRRITVRDCSIYDCSRAGINVGDGAWGGHLFERNDLFDTVLETHDHGSFNSWGRDRYWHSDRGASQKEVDKDPTLPFLDAMETTVIRNNRMRCDHGWDIDLDDGSSNYDIYNNLMLAGGLKLREGFRRRAWNNITINNGLHPHVWYNDSGDEVFGNLFMAPPKPARMPTEKANGKRMDGNLYFTTDPRMKSRYVQFGWDLNSIIADPRFVDPAAGDFQVQEGSPAFEIGFENFPMDQFGVKKPSLKAMSQTPVIPELEIRSGVAAAGLDSGPISKPMSFYFKGAQLIELQGEAFSAFGVAEEDGGVALTELATSSDAARHGLLAGDVIQGVNGRSVKRIADLLGLACEIEDRPISLKVVRSQQTITVNINDGAYLEIEGADRVDRFANLVPGKPSPGIMSANGQTNNDPVSTLVDGKLTDGYGPVFPNGKSDGAYRLDLGQTRNVSAITSWTHNRNGVRGSQKLTIYGSDTKRDPGWDLDDRSRFTPLGSIDTTSLESRPYQAVSLRASDGESLGRFRWIVWRVAPVTNKNENSAFQELAVQ